MITLSAPKMPWWRVPALRRHLLSVALDEVRFDTRGFQEGVAGIRPHLEAVGLFFLYGYHTALTLRQSDRLAQQLQQNVPLAWQGFAFEGAGMGLALQDLLFPWRRDRWRQFVSGPGQKHIYHLHVGAGWAPARLRLPFRHPKAPLDSVLGWLAADGYGFHEGYFNAARYRQGPEAPRRVQGYARRAFDQGLGRSLWFSHGAGVNALCATLDRYAPARRADLWSGVGLACAYAGGADHNTVQQLAEAAHPYRAALAQGVAFATQSRLLAGNLVSHTELACTVICGQNAAQVAAITQRTFPTEPGINTGGGQIPAYERWRQQVQAAFS